VGGGGRPPPVKKNCKKLVLVTEKSETAPLSCICPCLYLVINTNNTLTGLRYDIIIILLSMIYAYMIRIRDDPARAQITFKRW